MKALVYMGDAIGALFFARVLGRFSFISDTYLLAAKWARDHLR